MSSELVEHDIPLSLAFEGNKVVGAEIGDVIDGKKFLAYHALVSAQPFAQTGWDTTSMLKDAVLQSGHSQYSKPLLIKTADGKDCIITFALGD